ncbi:MAG: phosphatidylinositol mannoside acyltransferase [Nitriliruptorales bacterium]|nr:phosphatidylinositol mannoside acyltransferase [Nitriliruptorales bacterium]
MSMPRERETEQAAPGRGASSRGLHRGGGYRGSGFSGVPVDRNPGAADRIPPDSRPEPRRQRLAGRLWLLAWETARRLPEPLAFGLADLGGGLAARIGGKTRSRVARNLARVLGRDADDPVTQRAAREAFRSYARYWIEAFRAADLDPADLDARTTSSGFEHLDAALDEGRGAIVLLAHHGSWDVAAQWGETHGYHLAVVAEVVRPRRLFERFVRLRESMGLEVVPLQRSRGQASERGAGALVQTLSWVTDANHMVGLLSDRDLTRKGPLVELFGEPAHIPRGPAVLSQRTGAPIIPITLLQRPGRRWHVQALPRIDVAGLDVQAATARVARGIEDLIRLDPPQWHCFSPIWLADRRGRGGNGGRA